MSSAGGLGDVVDTTGLDIPFWPDPFCAVDSSVSKCTWLGITVSCKEPITWDSEFASGAHGGHVWIFLVLFVLGLSSLAYVPRPWLWQDSMKVTTGLYSAETAFFAIFRIYWGLGKPLIAGAALHNLFEWSIVLHLSRNTRNEAHFQKNVGVAACWILAVVSITIMIPNLLTAFLVEQATGIMLDFGMPMMFIYMWWNKRNSKDEHVRNFYICPAIAHTIHILFTIIPLVNANFHVGNVSWYSSFWLEVAIYISAPVSHILYISWAWEVDRLRANTENNLLPKELRIPGVWRFLLAGFFMGIFQLFIYPLYILKPCGPTPPECTYNHTQFTGTSVALVNVGFEGKFIDLVQKHDLVKAAKRSKGNIDYKLVQNTQQPREFRFVEVWKDRDAVTDWITKGLPSELFRDPEMVETLAGGVLTGFASYKELGAKCTYEKRKP